MKRLALSLCSILLISIIALVGAAQKRGASKGAQSKGAQSGPSQAVLDGIKADAVMQHIKILSSDEYEGRGPGTRGEEKTVEYITEQFKQVGLAPGNTDKTYVQKVPLV